jgi:hypothetical protein
MRDKEDTDMPYELLPAEEAGKHLFFRLEGEAAERHGSIGYMRADFGKTGKEFWTTWFDCQTHLKSFDFKNEFNAVVDSLRNDGPEPPFASRDNLAVFCAVKPGRELSARGGGYTVRTHDYSYCFRCLAKPSDYDIYCFAYDNRYLLPELAGQHELPEFCYGIMPSSGELILVKRNESGYYRCENSSADERHNREYAGDANIRLGVTRAQEEAMLAGSIFGWDIPAAKPWNYDINGNLRRAARKRDEPER